MDDENVHRAAFLNRLKLCEEDKERWCGFLQNIWPHWWPEVADDRELFVHRESHFHSYLLNNRRMQYRLGWHSIVRSQIMCPDLIVRPFGAAPGTPARRVLRVELEFDAANFTTHGHDPSGVHLVLAFRRPVGFERVRGVPVWSFYNYDPMGEYRTLRWCLDDDIRRPLPPFYGGTSAPIGEVAVDADAVM